MIIFRWFVKQCIRLLGWKCVGSIPPHVKKAVVIFFPHTSNWDAFYCLVMLFAKNLPIKFAIKQEAMFFPLGPILKWIGAIPIDRAKKSLHAKQKSMTHVMATIVQQQEFILLGITPEGTRSCTPRWRKGFYQIAIKAEVPIILSYLDYVKKQGVLGPIFYPTGDMEKDIQQIKTFYKDKVDKGRYPEKSTL